MRESHVVAQLAHEGFVRLAKLHGTFEAKHFVVCRNGFGQLVVVIKDWRETKKRNKGPESELRDQDRRRE